MLYDLKYLWSNKIVFIKILMETIQNPSTYWEVLMGDLVAYARILDQGLSYTDYSSIGRIVVSPAYRAQKLGHELVYFAIKTTQKEYANSPIKISAQAHLEKFYEVHQFKATGEAYLEDGIPHIGMLLEA